MLNTWSEKLHGLLGTGPNAAPVMLTRCSSVHTVGMAYELDLAFVGEHGEVLEVHRGVEPGSLVSCDEASCVVERPSVQGEWLASGEHLWACAISAELF